MKSTIGLRAFVAIVLLHSCATKSEGDTVQLLDGSRFSDLHVGHFDGVRQQISIEKDGRMVEIRATEVGSMEFGSPSAKLTLRDGSTYSSVEVQAFDGVREAFAIWHNEKTVEIPASEVREIRFAGTEDETILIDTIDAESIVGWSDEELFSNLPPGCGSEVAAGIDENPYVPRWKGQGAKKGLDSATSVKKKSVAKSTTKTVAQPSKEKRKRSSTTRERSRSRSSRERGQSRLSGGGSESPSQQTRSSEGRFGEPSGNSGMGGLNGSTSSSFSLGGSW